MIAATARDANRSSGRVVLRNRLPGVSGGNWPYCTRNRTSRQRLAFRPRPARPGAWPGRPGRRNRSGPEPCRRRPTRPGSSSVWPVGRCRSRRPACSWTHRAGRLCGPPGVAVSQSDVPPVGIDRLRPPSGHVVIGVDAQGRMVYDNDPLRILMPPGPARGQGLRTSRSLRSRSIRDTSSPFRGIQ